MYRDYKHVKRIHGLLILILAIGFFLFAYAYHRERENEISLLEESVELMIDGIQEQLVSIDKLYYALELYADETLHLAIEEMNRAYENGQLDQAEMELIRAKYEHVELYLINRENVIELSTLVEDVGLDFNKYEEYVAFFDEIRRHKKYVSERIDIALETDKIMKYSYMTTKDGRYILDASYDMESFENIQKESSFDYFSSKLFLNNEYVKEISLYEYYNDLESRMERIYTPDEMPMLQALLKARGGGISSYVDKRGQYEEKTFFIPYFINHSREGSSVFIIKFTYTNQHILEQLNELFLYFGFALLLFVTAIGVSIRYYNRMVFRPVMTLLKGFEQVAANDLKVDVVPYGVPTLKNVMKTFNQMVQNIDELIEEKEKSAEDLRLHLKQSEQGYLSTVTAMANTIDAKDQYTGGHCERVMQMSIMLAEFLSLSDKEIRDIMYASVLHDIGKIGIEDVILNKVGRFTDIEYAKMKKHPEIGYEIISSIDFLQDCGDGILYHHERVDGLGYPSGLKGDDIPFIGRLLAITDAFDAMTSRRIYRPTIMTVKEAFNELEKCSGTHFDTILVLKFKEAYIKAFGRDLNHFADEIE